MATDSLPTSLSHALGSPSFSTRQYAVHLPSDIAVGSVIVGGFTACIMTKYALHHASQHPELQNQVDLRYSEVHFYRPIFASTPITLTLREVHIAKEGSTLHVESHQNGKLTASAYIRITKPSVAGITLPISYHCAFYPTGFRRSQSYAKNFIPRALPTEFAYIEQWVEPGWDYLPLGSRPSGTGQGKARWTNDMIQFVGDMALPIQENYMPHEEGEPLPLGSIAATLEFAKRQEKTRNESRNDWRVLDDDGSKEFWGKVLNVSLTLSLRTSSKRFPLRVSDGSIFGLNARKL
ncbi:hypothetical protein AAWM_06051 [Aspergillus awamori]|uniref:Acyl-CoA thioesterase-like N-terminal HotDog domain-containing protein n=1 Tax=Aspergillus awamori TaxID=105351 RepID=A0A401KV50_ASPAW|nr:hypothetical protein AAWM_06051 [Aspergillus awamori]GKZ56731.1 hypothetical protein AnigIFM49718_002001 [Aspergillus niger]